MRVLTPGDRFVPWRREMPPEWSCKALKYCVRINSETLPEGTPGDYEIRYIDIGCVSATGHIASPELMTFNMAPSRARRVVRQGDTIVSTVRTYLKAIAFIEGRAPNSVCSTGFAVLRPGHLVWPKFLFYWARSSHLVDEVCARSVGVSYPGINAIEIGNLPFPVVPVEYQNEIAAYLDARLAEMDSMMETARSLVASGKANGGLITEYRDALITAAVTGKIDVRRGTE